MDAGRRGFLKILGLGTAATAATAIAQVAAPVDLDPLDGAVYLGAVDLISARADGTGKVEIAVDLAASSKDALPPICFPSSKFPRFLDAENRLGGGHQRKILVFESWKDLRESTLGFNPAVLTGSHAIMGAKIYLRPETPLG